MPPPHAERAQWRPHWLGWGGGFELSDPEKPPLEHGLTATEGGSARHIHCRMDRTGVQVTLWQLSREKSLIAKRSENEGKFGPHFKGQFWKRHLRVRILPPQPASAVSAYAVSGCARTADVPGESPA